MLSVAGVLFVASFWPVTPVAAAAVLPPSAFIIKWKAASSGTNRYIVEVSGADAAAARQLGEESWKPDEWHRLLSVYAGQGDLLADVALPPMNGTYSMKGATIRFEPQFPLEPGVKYRATFNPRQLPGAHNSASKLVAESFALPVRASAPTTVVNQIFPSAHLLPENLLKFYLAFSAPMSRGHIYDHIHLRNEAGTPIELPFLEIDEELWNPEMTRLTLFLDPGRIKRGVRPLEEVGPALEQGKRYTLIIDRDWRDAAGNALKSSFEKAFAVGPPDREPPNPVHWKIQPPSSGTDNPLVIKFPEPMDYALAQRVIRVATSSGALVPGRAQLTENESVWEFHPSQSWQKASYRLLVQTTIEDLAGNNIGKAFEIDVFEKVDRQFTNTTVKLPFDVH